MLIKQSKTSMLEKSKLKKKSKYLKKPLELKNTISETLAHNSRAESILKKGIPKPPPSKPKHTSQDREAKLQDLYHQVELQHKSDSETDNSEQMLLADLERQDEDEEGKREKRDKKTILFSHLVKDSGHLGRKLSVLEERVNQKIKKYSIESKIKEMGSKRVSPQAQQNCSLLPKAVERSLARLSEEGATEVRLANMQLTHLSLVRMKDQVGGSGKLRKLDLSYNSLTNKSMGVLADVLSQNMVEELSLKWNQLTYEGAMQLLEAVTYNINLSSLDLSYNKLTNSNPAFQECCLRLLAHNKYLTHLNLQMCHLSEDQCAVLARAYNLTNESILCLHFKGNSHYYVNKLGYITKNRAHKEVPNITTSMNRLSHMPNFGSRYLIADDCCWLCQHWVGEVFKIPQEIFPVGLVWQEGEYFIHLSCYDFQPIRLSNQECINTVQPRKDCKRLEWSNYEVHLAQIPVPANKDIKFFFTLKGKALINQNEPSIEVSQMVSFEVFDVFGELYAGPKEAERYSVFVRRMNTRSKEDLGYNKLKKLKGEACESSFREAFRKENQKALKSILNKNKKASIHSTAFEPLPRISKTKPSTPTHSRTHTDPQNTPNVIINIRKCKEKLPSTAESEKYLSLGMVPRNKQFLFNYKHFKGHDFTEENAGTRQEELQRVETEYFGSFKETFMARFLRQRELAKREDPFMDRFKILTRRFFNSHEMFFSDVFSFLYSNFISLDTPAEREREVKQAGKNKSVKFLAPPKDTKLSIVINSEKQLEGKIGTEATSMGTQQQRAVERRALSMNCISDKYQLTKLKAMPVGSIHTLHSNMGSTDKTIKSFKDIPTDPACLLQFSLDHFPLPIELTEDVFAHYSTLTTRYAREKRVILELINGCQRNCEKEKLRELNEIILTYNYYKLTLFYESTVQSGLEELLVKAGSFSALASLLQPPLPFLLLQLSKKNNSSLFSSSLEGGIDAVQDLQALERQITSQSIEESLLSLGEYLGSEQHPMKVLMRSEAGVMKSSKKRKGKYGRSLKNIKEELLREQTKVVLPADSDKFLQEIEQEELNAHYNTLVSYLNALTDPLLEVLDHLVNNYLTSHSCGDERGIVEQWLKAHITARIGSFISDILAQYRTPGLMGKVQDRTAEVCSQFTLNSVLELAKVSLMLGSSVLQQHFKEYQFISPFHSYEFIISVEITKLTHITRALQDAPRILQHHLAEVLRLLSESWKKHQLDLVQKEKAKKQAEATRKMKRIKTINESIERALPPEQSVLS